MMDTPDGRDFQAKLQRLDSLIQGLERLADPAARAQAREVVQSLLELHGIGLERILDHVAEGGEPGIDAIRACGRDEVAGGLLLLHGLHPLGTEERVLLAIEQVRPQLSSHGCEAELLDVRDGVARLRLVMSGHGCPSSTRTMRQTIEEAVMGRAPDLLSVAVESDSPEPMTTPDGRPLVMLSFS